MKDVPSIFRRTAFAAAALTVMALGQSASAQSFSGGVNVAAADVNFVGRDGNWFNPSNWSSGRVPGADDNVTLDGDDYVLIDAGADPSAARVEFAGILVSSVAVLEVRNGAMVQTRSQVLKDQGQIIFRGSSDVGENLVVDASCTDCVLVLNPTLQSKRIIVLKSSATVDVGLGGTEAASVRLDAAGGHQLAAGRGYYATTTVDALVIDGDLKLSTYYDFSPRPGQSFQIATVNGVRTGEFTGIPEGGYVGCTEENIGLRLSYAGGDGNDLVVSAEQTEPGICLLLPAVQKVREAAVRTNIQARIDKLPLAAAIEEGVTQTREHILLARQTQIALPEQDADLDKMPTPTIPISGPKPTPK